MHLRKTAEQEAGPPSSATMRAASPLTPTAPIFPAAVRSSVRTTTSSAPPRSSQPPDRRAREIIAPGITVARPTQMEWRPFPFLEGVTLKVLLREGEIIRAIVRLAPGAEIPRHRHAAVEDLYVIEGTLVSGELSLRAGEHCHSEAGSVHDTAVAPGGCTFLLIGSEKNEPLI